MRVRSLMLLFLTVAAGAVDLSWSGAPGASAPPGWSVVGPVTFLDRTLRIEAPNTQRALAETTIALPDGSDERPLRLSAVMRATGDRATEVHPLLMALAWDDGRLFAVGLGDATGRDRNQRRAWAMWAGVDGQGVAKAALDLSGHNNPVHVRLVVSSLEVAAFASPDGHVWTRIAGQSRQRLGALGAPQRVMVGRGAITAEKPGLAGDPPGPADAQPSTYTIKHLRLEDDRAQVPASALRSYTKLESLSDTVEAIEAPGRPRRWRLSGPDPLPRGGDLPLEVTAAALAAREWKEIELGEHDRILPLSRHLPSSDATIRWAATDLVMPEPGWVRLRFDSSSSSRLWINGEEVATVGRRTSEAEIDRFSTSVWLDAGTHALVLAVRSSERGRSAVALRWEAGDPRARVALLRRLLVDFPGDEQLEDAFFELSRLWEGLGFAREAVAVLDDLAAGEDSLAERALAERARLLHRLGDATAAAEATTTLQRLWAAVTDDPVQAARRTARLWLRLDAPDQALGAIASALTQPALSPTDRGSLEVERARLYHAIGDQAGVARALQASAEHLPVGDGQRFELLALALRADPAAAAGGQAAQVADGQQARLLAGVLAARNDESGRIAARRRAAELPVRGFALPAIELAEDHVAAKDEAGAAKLYAAELARRRLPAPKNLAAGRVALVRAVLAEQPAGAALLAEVDRLPPDQARPMMWRICGPLPLGDWKAHEQPAFDLAKGPAGAIAGQAWRDVPADAWQQGSLDLLAMGGGDNAVMYLATVIDSPAERVVSASFGADDGLSVWVNGKRLHSDREQRGLQPDAIALGLPLVKGRNVVVVSVQNGNGPTAFQYRVRLEPWPASELAAALAQVQAGGGGRDAAGRTLARLAETLIAEGRQDDGVAVARAVLAGWPDQYHDGLAWRLLTEASWGAPSAVVGEALAWYDAMLADRRWDDGELRQRVRDHAAGRLVAIGQLDQALARLDRDSLVELDPVAVAATHLRQAALWLSVGVPHRAAIAIARARDAAPDHEATRTAVAKATRDLRARTGSRVVVPTSFEAVTRLRTADRAAGSGDHERAASDWQQAIEGGRDELVEMSPGVLRGVAAYGAARLAAADVPLRAAWLDRQASRAASALERVRGTSDREALDRIALRWPLAPAAGEALRLQADLWASQGVWPLALGAANRVLEVHPAIDPGPVLVRAAHAAAKLGDVARLDALLARLASLGQPQIWDGRRLPPDRLAAALRALLPTPQPVDPRRAVLVVELPSYRSAQRTAVMLDAVAPSPAVAMAGDLLVVALPDAVLALGAQDGRQRWRLAEPALPVRPAPALAGQGATAALTIDGHLAVAGIVRDGARRLVAIEAATGHERWSSDNVPALDGRTLASAPTVAGDRIWAWFLGRLDGVMACFDATDGAVVWSTRLPLGLSPLPLVGATDQLIAGDAPAPALHGREVFLSTDAGVVAAFDAVEGRVLWLHAYQRNVLDARSDRAALRRLLARGRGAVLVDDARVYIAPRDQLGLLAIDRRTGAQAWIDELADVRELVALTPQGLLTVGDQAACFDPRTGTRRWRSAAAAGTPLGAPAIIGGTAWYPTARGLFRVTLDTGAAALGPAWKALGLASAPTELTSADGRILAAADGLVALLAGAGAAAPTRIVVADPPPRPLVHAVAASGAAAPAAVAVRWELAAGAVERLTRPRDGDAEELFAVAGGRLLRFDAAGTVRWSTPMPPVSMRGLTIAGDAVLTVNEGTFAVFDRSSGRLRWRDGVWRDPILAIDRRDPWHQAVALFPGAVLRYDWRDPAFTLRSSVDGSVLVRGRTNGGIIGAHAAGDELYLVVVRGRSIAIEVRRRFDGLRIHEQSLGLDGHDSASVYAVDAGNVLVGNRAGGVIWDAAKRTTKRFDLGMHWFGRVFTDEGRHTLVGMQDQNLISTTISAAGEVLSRTDYGRPHSFEHGLRLVERWVGDRRIRVIPNRNRQTGLQVSGSGMETAWLPTREENRRHYHGVFPLGRHALAFANDSDGILRVQVVDPSTATLMVESLLATNMVERAMPIAIGSDLIIGTSRGLMALTPVSASGSEAVEPVRTIWRTPQPLVIDGRLDDWEGQATWRHGAEKDGIDMRATWNDAGLAVAFTASPSPVLSGHGVLVFEHARSAFRVEQPPFILALRLDGGRSQVQPLTRMAPDDDRPLPTARAIDDGGKMTWEVLIPWPWLYGRGERPGRDHGLRLGVILARSGSGEPPLASPSGLVGAIDKHLLSRLRLADRAPDDTPRGKK